MATITSIQSGNWSDPATWDTGTVPDDGDTVVIASGHEVKFDVDQSAFVTGLAGLQVNGLLYWDNAVTTYLKMAGHITGSGELRVATYDLNPVATTIYFNGDYYINGGYSLKVYIQGNERDPMWDTLANAAAVGDTVLQLTGTIDVKAGDKIVIMDKNGWEEAEVASYDNVNCTITLASGLTNSYEVGAGVGLWEWDDAVKILPRSGRYYTIRYSSDGFYVSGAVSGAYIGGIVACSNAGTIKNSSGLGSIAGGVAYVVNESNMLSCVGVVTSGRGGIVATTRIAYVSDCLGYASIAGGVVQDTHGGEVVSSRGFAGDSGGCGSGVCSILFIKCYGSDAFLYKCSGCIVLDSETENTALLSGTNNLFVNTDGDITVVPASLTGRTITKNNTSEVHHLYGGAITIEETVSYQGRPIITMTHNANNGVLFYDISVIVQSASTKTLQVYCKKSASGYTPKVQLLNRWDEPLLDNTVTPLTEVSMTDTVNEWVTLSFAYTFNEPGIYKLRLLSPADAPDGAVTEFVYLPMR